MEPCKGEGEGTVDPLRIVLVDERVVGSLVKVEPFLCQEGGEFAQE